MNGSEMLAPSRQPLATVSGWPRFGISTISGTPLLSRWRSNDAFAIAHGAVLSFSPEVINRGPRSGFSISTFASVQRVRVAVAGCNKWGPGAGTGNGRVRALAA